MERITDKDTKMVALEGADEVSELLAKTYNKLMLYENIEEELGIDLVTLRNALTNGIYCIKKSVAIGDFISCVDVKFNGYCLIDCEEEIHYFNDYGKTWDLTKEELENEQV